MSITVWEWISWEYCQNWLPVIPHTADVAMSILDEVDVSPQFGTIQSFSIGNWANWKSNHCCNIEFSFEREDRKFSQSFLIIVDNYSTWKREFDELMEKLGTIIPIDLDYLEQISYNIHRKRAAIISECDDIPILPVRFIRNPENFIVNIGHATEDIWLYPTNEAA